MTFSLDGSDPEAAVGGQLEAPFPNRPQPSRRADEAAEAEEMDAGDRPAAMARNLSHHDFWPGFDQKARNRLGPRLQRADRIPDPAKRRKPQQARQTRRAREPDAHGKTVSFHSRHPRQHRLGLEAELRHHLQIETRPPGEAFFRGQRRLEREAAIPG